MQRSNFSPTGLAIGDNNVNMTYLYGVSDFFHVMFEDTSRVNLFLEAGAEVASETYSKFLQLTSSISLEEIQKTLGQTLKLVTIKSTDRVLGEVNVYTLPESILKTRYIANRPLLPTALLEQDVDYRIENSADGSLQIRFAKDITDAGFSTRLLSDQTTKEYALWFVDAEIDEGWISSNYANLIGVDPATSTEAYKNFIYGLYYIYIQGPTLDMLRKGLNLCLGVPLARESETVLEIRKYLETDQYVVITDQNQYIIPYGLDPSVVEGDSLNVGDELARWVEVKDYINDGEWWINLMIPSTIIPDLPGGQINRYATKGSHFDYLMRQYLKKHTFLVNVKVQDFKNNQVFSQLSDIIKRAKPAYTQAVYIWTIPKLEEEATLSEDMFIQRRDQSRCDNLTYAIEKFYRGNSTDALKRGCPTFIRYNVPFWVAKLSGTDAYHKTTNVPFNGGIINGFNNYVGQYRPNTLQEKAWLRTIDDRNSEILAQSRSKIGFYRSSFDLEDTSGVTVHPIFNSMGIPPGTRIIPLYITTQSDLDSKCQASFIGTPDISQWSFELLKINRSESINSLAINDSRGDSSVNQLVKYFDIWKSRGSDVNYLSNVIPELGFKNFTSFNSADVQQEDYLIGIRIYDKAVAIFWVTTNNTLSIDPFHTVEENDQLTMTFSARPSRGMGPMSSPYYLLRGRGRLDYNNVMSAVNEAAVNDAATVEASSVITEYYDTENASRAMLRDGRPLVHKMEVK